MDDFVTFLLKQDPSHGIFNIIFSVAGLLTIIGFLLATRKKDKNKQDELSDKLDKINNGLREIDKIQTLNSYRIGQNEEDIKEIKRKAATHNK